MATVPLATGARLLGIHPKTLRHWLTTAQLPLAAHPTDARIRCVAQADLLEVARRHRRPVPELSSAPAPDAGVASGFAAEQAQPRLAHETGPAALTELRAQLAQLHTQVATLQHHLTGLALHVLHERTEGYEQRLRSLEALLSVPLEVVPTPQQADVAEVLASYSPPAQRLLPVEVRARSRVSALIEYGAGGQYVAVCPKRGVLALLPDSPAWFDWLATLSSFCFVGPAGRFSACRASAKGQYTRRWAARRFFHGHDFWHYLGVTDRLTLVCLEEAAAALQARVDAL
jgi:DNA-binding transcriptional MerR regulator